jgi:hypothetical protein
MKKHVVLIGVLTAAVFIAGCTYYQPGMSAVLRQGKQGVLSGEITTIFVDAWAADGSALSYEWSENGARLDGTGPSISWSRFVTTTTKVTIRVTVFSANGDVRSASEDLSVSPVAAPATLIVVNDSPYAVRSLYASQTGQTDWGPDQMRPSGTIAAQGGTFTLGGIPAGTWDLAAEGLNGSPSWTSNAVLFAAGQSVVLHLK